MLLNLVKKSVLYFLFYFVFTALSYVQGALVMKLWTTSIEHAYGEIRKYYKYRYSVAGS